MEDQPIGDDDTLNLTSAQSKRNKAKQAYCNKVDRLSDKSVTGIHFHPDTDIDWDNPDFEIRDDDVRWILPLTTPLGKHEWYRSLSPEEQIRIGKLYIANVILTGAQFEKLLNIGILTENIDKSVMDPDVEYPLKEAGDEINHIVMFHKLVKLISMNTGIEPKGAPKWFRRLGPLLAATAPDMLPAGFWTFVYAGEEPIDQMQKSLLQQDANMPPVVERIMDIHIKEEARHISYVKQRLERYFESEKMSRFERMSYEVLYPIMMRVAAEIIMHPSKAARHDMGIPDDVDKEVWGNTTSGRESLNELFSDTRKFADKNNLCESKLARFAWKICGLDIPSPGTKIIPSPAN